VTGYRRTFGQSVFEWLDYRVAQAGSSQLGMMRGAQRLCDVVALTDSDLIRDHINGL
jgi:hypothetical protein